MKNVLIINAHQKYEGFAEGKLNESLSRLAEDTLQLAKHNIKTTVVDGSYDIAEELEKHQWADIIIVQTPVYWFGTPWIFKKYIDEVYTSAMGKLWESDGRSSSDPDKLYGSGGLVQEKQYMISTTWNAPEEAFTDNKQFFNGNDVDTVFTGLHKMYQFLGMKQISSFNCYDVMKNPQIETDLSAFTKHINTVIPA